jgi:hypothetical protein
VQHQVFRGFPVQPFEESQPFVVSVARHRIGDHRPIQGIQGCE